ncbi:hypothetical protein K438DRAFT_1979439 [Mycena galopus ATCC 62051]|nr:hypothetical protein K438DRAFT_1979439 [Mycena galopus ATCC 62051]
MSQTVAELQAVAPEGQNTGFPAAWLTPQPDKHRSAPQTTFSVEWNKACVGHYLSPQDYGVEVAGLIIRMYFDLPGCIIPVAYIPDHPQETFIFTIAGPCDAEGKKDFYIFTEDSPLSRNCLHVFRPGFASVEDFHRNRRPEQLVRVLPCPEKEAQTEDALIECGFLEVPTEFPYEFSDHEYDDE